MLKLVKSGIATGKPDTDDITLEGKTTTDSQVVIEVKDFTEVTHVFEFTRREWDLFTTFINKMTPEMVPE